jgi:hypothetical protein
MKVIFRKFKDGDVIALLPECEANYGCVMTYQHIGQHGEAYLTVTQITKPATEVEYCGLLSELQRIYEGELVVTRRVQHRDLLKAWGRA